MKKIFSLLCVSALLVGMTSCTDNDPEKDILEHTIFQEYSIEFMNENVANVFARFTLDSADGANFVLKKFQAVSANDMLLKYEPGLGDGYDYRVTISNIASYNNSVKLRFLRDGEHSYYTSIKYADITTPSVTGFPRSIALSSRVELGFRPDKNEKIMVNMQNLSSSSTVNIEVAADGSIIIPPTTATGNYNVNIVVQKTFDIDQADARDLGYVYAYKSAATITNIVAANAQ